MSAEQTENEYSQFQSVSDEYIPELIGPLIGELEPTSSIAQAFAFGGPVFRVKSKALQKRWLSYRTSRGDGNCGWRAVSFGYFECCARLRDKVKCYEEIARLTSLNNLINEVGDYQEDDYEEFAKATRNLLHEIANATDPDAVLLANFNDEMISNSVITYIRLITSAWMRKHPEAYQPYLVDQTVHEYCSTQIEPFKHEIDNLGISALVDVLIKPAGLALEIAHLDQSPGDEVNTHRFEPTDDTGAPLYTSPPTVSLLYRPGHYDILYRAESVQPLVAPEPAPSTIRTQLVHNMPSHAYPRHGQSLPYEDLLFVDMSEHDKYALPEALAEANILGGTGSLVSNTSFSDLVCNALPSTTGLIGDHVFVPEMHDRSGSIIDSLVEEVPLEPVSAFDNSFVQGLRLRHQLPAVSDHPDPPFTTRPMLDAKLTSHYEQAHHLSNNFQPVVWTPEDSDWPNCGPSSQRRCAPHRPSR